jgi:CRISPR-associated protein Cas1
MVRAKVLRLVVDDCGSYIGMEKGCFVIKGKNGDVNRIPLFENEIGEIIVSSGNYVSTSVLASCGFWDIPVVVVTRNHKPVAVLRGLDDDAHVKTRIAQYEALKNGKGLTVAKQIVYSKIESQNVVLRKYGLEQHDLMTVKAKIENIESANINDVRKRLIPIEGKASEFYFKQIFQLLPKRLRIEKRKGWKAFDGVNNTFNLAYTFLKYRVYSAILKAHLEPYLGFVHGEQFGKPSLVCDFMELYRYLIDNFIIEFSQTLKSKDFILKTEWYSTNRLAKRQVLNHEKAKELMQSLNRLFETKVEIPRIRHGNKQTVETLINEEAYLLAKYLRGERNTWIPRIPIFKYA